MIAMQSSTPSSSPPHCHTIFITTAPSAAQPHFHVFPSSSTPRTTNPPTQVNFSLFLFTEDSMEPMDVNADLEVLDNKLSTLWNIFEKIGKDQSGVEKAICSYCCTEFSIGKNPISAKLKKVMDKFKVFYEEYEYWVRGK
ncbi:hypothetical protein P8452_42774 [Trifolium repens]|nr:hypothetical protein P8452_42774 [Trifolium repens]